jgi:CheY-like chemotaxis protein
MAGWMALNGLKILVVDDEADARQLLSTILAHAGAEIAVAGSADEALAVFERLRPDVLVSDIGMPEKDGNSLTAYARAGTAAKPSPAGFRPTCPSRSNLAS